MIKKRLVWLCCIAFTVAFLSALSMGRYPIGPLDLVRIVFANVGIGDYLGFPSTELQLVFWNIRVPRILMSVAVGSGISVSGAVFQALFRNPLAAPDILGVTGGACFGAALSIAFLTQSAFGVQGLAFAFGILAVSIAYGLAQKSWDRSTSVLVISGIVVSAIFQAGVSIIMYLSEPFDQLTKILFWIMGSFQTSSWTKVQTTVPLVLSGSFVLAIFSWRLNIMTQHEEEALSIGVDVFRWRLFYVVAATLIVASSVAAVGTISWVGLMVPHIARYLVGADHRRLVPASALIGGGFLLSMDTIARTAFASEIPISVITSVVGAPFLGYLMILRRRNVMMSGGYGNG